MNAIGWLFRRPPALIAALVLVAALAWLVGWCPAVVLVDGSPHVAFSSCTMSGTNPCHQDQAPLASNYVDCDYPGGADDRDIYVSFAAPQGLLVASDHVEWERAKSDTPDSTGGVLDFRADRGALIDATVRDDDGTHHVIGMVRC